MRTNFFIVTFLFGWLLSAGFLSEFLSHLDGLTKYQESLLNISLSIFGGLGFSYLVRIIVGDRFIRSFDKWLNK